MDRNYSYYFILNKNKCNKSVFVFFVWAIVDFRIIEIFSISLYNELNPAAIYAYLLLPVYLILLSCRLCNHRLISLNIVKIR